EVAVLDRTRPQQRKFKRIVGRQLTRLLDADAAGTTPTDAPSDVEDADTPEAGSSETATPENRTPGTGTGNAPDSTEE
ncbi:proteasome subunit alpha, partial [Streptomyces sp. SID8455]|nr:proteasome subunit alpha [Streptomyces sp. SID8455]